MEEMMMMRHDVQYSKTNFAAGARSRQLSFSERASKIRTYLCINYAEVYQRVA